MKTLSFFLAIIPWLMAERTEAQINVRGTQMGLKGDYYTGVDFERKVFSRIDRTLSFNWSEGSPGRGIPHSYYSVRWTGKLLAPVSGKYKFYAVVDDGIRIWVGTKKVVESWKLNDSNSYEGSIELTAGQLYDLRIDYFNDMMGGELELYWQRPDKKNPILDRLARNGEPVPAQYFFQKTSQDYALKLPKYPFQSFDFVPLKPSKAAAKKQPVTLPKPVLNSPPAKRRIPIDTITSPVPVRQSPKEPLADLKPGTTFILHHVQFGQSSYTLLPESSTELDQLIAVLKKNPGWYVEVAGHTDNVGDPRLNLALSENRAKVVANYLTRRGISNDRIMPKGYGGTRPVTNNSTEEERAKNRRVEITIN